MKNGVTVLVREEEISLPIDTVNILQSIDVVLPSGRVVPLIQYISHASLFNELVESTLDETEAEPHKEGRPFRGEEEVSFTREQRKVSLIEPEYTDYRVIVKKAVTENKKPLNQITKAIKDFVKRE